MFFFLNFTNTIVVFEIFCLQDLLYKFIFWFQDEVAHTLTENRVLQTTNHPFLTVRHNLGETWSLKYLKFISYCNNTHLLLMHRLKYFRDFLWSIFFIISFDVAYTTVIEEK